MWKVHGLRKQRPDSNVVSAINQLCPMDRPSGCPSLNRVLYTVLPVCSETQKRKSDVTFK